MHRIKVTPDNRERVKKYYLSLCDQGRANFLYDNNIGGAELMLSPNQYPKASAMHRVCDCGAKPIMKTLSTFDKYDTYVYCPVCGCRSLIEQTPWWAWKAWDQKLFVTENDNLTIWEMM